MIIYIGEFFGIWKDILNLSMWCLRVEEILKVIIRVNVVMLIWRLFLIVVLFKFKFYFI